ncbi:MAG: chemotaxis protein CheW [Holophagales bacterium]|nr:chemotaxis protein CheW [Holophagales bacterium]
MTTSGTSPSRSGGPLDRLLTFRIGEVVYGVEASAIRASMAASSSLRGQVPFHGELFTLLDPRLLFDLPTLDRDCRALLLGGGDKAVALLVEEVLGELEVARERVQSLPWHFGGREQLWFRGLVVVEDRAAENGWGDGDGEALVLLRPAGLLASYRALLASRRPANGASEPYALGGGWEP